ncbi:hypothetical protein [Rhizobium sp. FKL33]|uniref:hypothetical protein n=1 Tax=Rhizobium sp. FKL33 TaxID=2562307 RepID=UPI001FEEEEEF|nr:hypothetical protein [Rhizobium sp. FKL33]
MPRRQDDIALMHEESRRLVERTHDASARGEFFPNIRFGLFDRGGIGRNRLSSVLADHAGGDILPSSNKTEK